MRLIDADKIEFVLPRTLTEEEKKTYDLVIKKAFENAPTVDALTWEDLRDSLNDNTEDVDSIGKRLDAFELLTVDRMMERWESLARKVEVLEKKFDILCDIEDHEHQDIRDRLNVIEEKGEITKTQSSSFWELLERDMPDGPPDVNRNVNRITKGDINWLIKQLKEGKWWLDNEAD